MADNITLSIGGTNYTIAFDDVAGVLSQRIIPQVAGADVASGNPLPITGALTDTQLRASAVPVSGPLTDTQLRATAVPVSGTFWQTTQPISAASLPLPTGAATAANQSTANTHLSNIAAAVSGSEYETVAASQTTQALGATGASGDRLEGLLIIPATTSPGAVAIKDGSNTAITVFTGGASSVSNLVPFPVGLGLISTSGAWQVTTGSNVSVIAVGNFT